MEKIEITESEYNNYKNFSIKYIYRKIELNLNRLLLNPLPEDKITILGNLFKYNKKIDKLNKMTYIDYKIKEYKFLFEHNRNKVIMLKNLYEKNNDKDTLFCLTTAEFQLYQIILDYEISLLQKYYHITDEDMEERGIPYHKLTNIYDIYNEDKLIYNFKIVPKFFKVR